MTVGVAVMEDVDTKQEVTTKEELQALRDRLENLRKKQADRPPRDAVEGKPYGWDDDIDGLAIFLEDLKQVMNFLINERILLEQRPLFVECWEVIEVRIDLAIAEIRTIDTEAHQLYVKLFNAGLTGTPWRVKVGEYWRRITSSPVPAVLEMADRILGSLFPILFALEPVKEFKETLESKLKHDGDPGLQGLNPTGREQLRKQAQKSA